MMAPQTKTKKPSPQVPAGLCPSFFCLIRLALKKDPMQPTWEASDSIYKNERGVAAVRVWRSQPNQTQKTMRVLNHIYRAQCPTKFWTVIRNDKLCFLLKITKYDTVSSVISVNATDNLVVFLVDSIKIRLCEFETCVKATEDLRVRVLYQTQKITCVLNHIHHSQDSMNF